MTEFLERYRLWIGSILFVLILVLSSFLIWREGKWKPEFEKRLQALEGEIAQSNKPENVLASDVTTDPSTLINQAQTSQPVAATPAKPTKASMPSASTKTVSSPTQSQTAPTPSSAAPMPTSTAPAAIPIVNINTASATELDLLPGIGPTYAQRIIDYRDSHGGFKTTEEIKNVKGIGDATFEKMKQYLTVN